AFAKQDIVGWGVLGVAIGLIAGFVSGGLFGAVEHGVGTGLLWGAFGLVAGALVGFFAGRPVFVHRLKSVGRLLAPGTSLLVAWSDRAVSKETLAPLVMPSSEHLVLQFSAASHGALLEAV
ncbi:MAG TPA: hypothetical protein VIX84_22280, partial [Acidimicrobiales bacterium]